MCGIVGILSPNPSASNLSRANDLLTHRGPDDVGMYMGEGIGMAARRLSIVDLAGGHQPLCNEDESVWLVCNGEIFNASALRVELQSIGHHFSTLTDTEAILHAYEQWGDQAISRLRGMFAFALWDTNRKRLLLARDRFGMKPLYYARVGKQFAFASEIRAILEVLPELQRQANLEALWQLFEIGFLPTPQTGFQDIFKLPAARLLIVEREEVHLKPYWQMIYPPAAEQRRTGLRQAAEEFVFHLKEAVNAWRMSDVPVSSLLSGGIDSSSLAALLNEMGSEPIHTFSLGFSESGFDEASLADETARYLGTHHHEVHFQLKDFDNLPAMVRHLEEPQCSGTILALNLLYKACHEAGFKVVMTGEGSDELLGGYSWYEGDQQVRWLYMLPRQATRFIAGLPFLPLQGSRRVLRSDARDPVSRFIRWQQAELPRRLDALLKIPPAPSLVNTWQKQMGTACQGLHPFNQLMFVEHQTRLVDYINQQMDQISMANSVEARPPFLDHLLWEFTATLPPGVKLGSHENKRLLRQGMEGRLPEAVLRRRKKGLAAPEDVWWRSKRLPEWAEEMLLPTSLAESGYFNVKEVLRLRGQHQTGQVNRSRVLTGILTTQLWNFEVLKGR